MNELHVKENLSNRQSQLHNSQIMSKPITALHIKAKCNTAKYGQSQMQSINMHRKRQRNGKANGNEPQRNLATQRQPQTAPPPRK